MEETDEDRDERADDSVEASDTIDSGDDADEVERARDDRRTTAGHPSNEFALQKARGGRWSMVDRAIPMFWACETAAPMDGRREPHEVTLAAGVDARLD